MTKIFNERLKGNLQEDFFLISQTYHQIMNRNRKLISIALKGSNNLPDSVLQEAARDPKHLNNLLIHYLTSISEQDKVIISNPEMQAMSFIWMNYGAFISSLNVNEAVSEDALSEFIKEKRTIIHKRH